MGLEVELFQDDVPSQLLCALCHKVVVSPVQASCSHLFCATCFKRRIKAERAVGSTCPLCQSRISSKADNPSVAVRVQLLNLRISCSFHCGKVCRLADLPDHAGDECPNTPVPCPNARPQGCRMKVKRSELAQHVEECDFRYVECEACGKRTIFCQLFSHQSRTRCLEKKLRQQVIKAMRAVNCDVRNHKRQLDLQHLRLEQEERQRIMDQVRRNTATRDQQRRGNRLHNSLDSSRTFVNPGADQESPRHSSSEQGREIFMTSSPAVTRESSRMTVSLRTPRHCTTAAGDISTCRKCRKRFLDTANTPRSCYWHPGPIIELFGGTCYTCGRLDYQPGCMMGYHQP